MSHLRSLARTRAPQYKEHIEVCGQPRVHTRICEVNVLRTLLQLIRQPASTGFMKSTQNASQETVSERVSGKCPPATTTLIVCKTTRKAAEDIECRVSMS